MLAQIGLFMASFGKKKGIIRVWSGVIINYYYFSIWCSLRVLFILALIEGLAIKLTVEASCPLLQGCFIPVQKFSLIVLLARC